MTWDRAVFGSRISDAAGHVRYEATSPNPAEIDAYLSAVCESVGDLVGRTVVVLGATPELRVAALDAGADVVAIDRSPVAWEVLGDWVSSGRERRVRGDWMTIVDHISGPVAAVFGDGIIGNLASLDDAQDLLEVLGGVLASDGVAVMRNVVVPADLEPEVDDAAQVLADPDVDSCAAAGLLVGHRSGLLDAREFAFGVRIVGHLDKCWDRVSGILDGAAVFAAIDAWSPDPPLTEAERAALASVEYRGPNLLPDAASWERTVAAAGFTLETLPLHGRHWYRYYPVQVLRPN